MKFEANLRKFKQHFEDSEAGLKVVSKKVVTTLTKVFNHKMGIKCIKLVHNADEILCIPQISSFNLKLHDL